MRYYAKHDKNGAMISFGIGYGGIEVTEEEYNHLMDKYKRTHAAISAVYNEEMAIEDIDEDIRENVQKVVGEMKAADTDPNREISDSEALAIILRGETT